VGTDLLSALAEAPPGAAENSPAGHRNAQKPPTAPRIFSVAGNAFMRWLSELEQSGLQATQ
jgi:hypothetical protein